MSDVVVIGAGLAGLAAALRLAQAGRSVTLATKGPGGLQLSQGTVDILGYTPERVSRPLEAVASVAPEHPYASLGADAVAAAVTWLADQLGPDLLVGDPSRNVHLPTAVGALRPTAMAQPSMLSGDAVGGRSYAVVGVRQLKDFPADLIAGNLARSTAPDGGALEASAAWIDLPARRGEADPNPVTYARAMDEEAFAARFARAVADAAGPADVVAVPAVLGSRRRSVWRQVTDAVGRDVCEIPMPPPSVPGLRLYEALLGLIRAAGVRFVQGSRIVGCTRSGDAIESVTLAAAGGPRQLRAASFVYAPGGFESGALEVDSYGAIAEPVFGLPLTATDALPLISSVYWGPHPLFEVGVRADAAGRPSDAAGAAVHPNLYVAGGIIAGAERWREKSGDGIAVATAVRAADHITGGNDE
ncbi:MAG: glycerol-3-phosphate dehydrogenase subunit GlpB [Actinomycetes bacterium]